MKTFQLIIFIFFGSFTFGQTLKYNISGNVKDCDSKVDIKGVKVFIKGNDTTLIETRTNSDGFFSVDCKLSSNDKYLVYTIVPENIGLGKIVNYGLCPYQNTEKLGYLNSSMRYDFIASDTSQNKDLVFNFCIIEIQAEYRFPSFFFKNNSLEFFTPSFNGYVTEDTTLDCFAGFLIAKESWVIEISGHSDSLEANPQQLSKLRAEKIRDILVAKGVDKRRVVIKYYGSSRMLGNNYFLYNANANKTERVENSNCRVVFSVLRSDFENK